MIERWMDIKQTISRVCRIGNGAVLPDDLLRDIHDEFGVVGDCDVTIHDPIRGPETWKWVEDEDHWLDPDGKVYAEVTHEGWRRVET